RSRSSMPSATSTAGRSTRRSRRSRAPTTSRSIPPSSERSSTSASSTTTQIESTGATGCATLRRSKLGERGREAIEVLFRVTLGDGDEQLALTLRIHSSEIEARDDLLVGARLHDLR